ncbi:hypothetical protein [Haloparvum sp. PAK95]|uniref:hypothetical protein n=1 Tax=Haloparvum sp. PAK95 TaxID=3418962 RepID=UPI003D2F425C
MVRHLRDEPAVLAAGLREKIPVIHYTTLMGAVGAVVAVPLVGSEPVDLLVAAAFAAVSGIVEKLTQHSCYSHSDTNVDPPATATPRV